MATLDSTTAAEYAAEVNAVDRAQAIVDALADPVSASVYNSDEIIVGAGVMTTPWAVASESGVTPSTLDGFFVTTGGTPDGGWTLRFESGSRSVKLSFGLASSGKEAVWSLDSWGVGTRSGISGGEIAVAGNRGPVWAGAPTTLAAASGTAQSFAPYASDPDEDQLAFSLVSATNGYSITIAGVLTVGTVSQPVTIRVTDPNGLTADHTCSVTVTPVDIGDVVAGTDWEEFASGFEFSSVSTTYPLNFGGTIQRNSNSIATIDGAAVRMFPVIVSTPTYRGSRSCKFPMPAISERNAESWRSELKFVEPFFAEVGGPYIEGTEHFIGWALYLNASFPTGAQSVSTSLIQSWATNDIAYYNRNPKMCVRVLQSGNYGFTCEWDASGGWTYDSGVSVAADVGTWVRLVWHIKYSTTTAGFLRLYRGVGTGALTKLTMAQTSGTTRNPEACVTWDGGSSVMNRYPFGNYSALRQYSADGDRTLYFDSLRIASGTYGGTIDSVDPVNY